MIINNYWTLITIIGVLIAIGIAKHDKKTGEKDTILGIIAIEVVLLIMAVVVCFLLALCKDHKVTETYTTKTELVALNDYTGLKEQLHGNYFLFFGSVDGEKTDTYNIRYAYKDSNNVIRIQSKNMNKDNIGFYEDDSKVMEVVHEKTHYELNAMGKLLFKNPDCGVYDKEIDYIFHIPKDSIIKDINIDLK